MFMYFVFMYANKIRRIVLKLIALACYAEKSTADFNSTLVQLRLFA